jgi:alkylation response protein AidB-like acyl-CoA dehydrogenase
MPRPLRIDVEDGWHHVMNRGIDHGDVFFDDTDRIEFGQRLADVHERLGALRTAASRARALLRAEPELLDAQRRGVDP